MKPSSWKRLIVVALFAAFAFGGSFSEWSCTSGGTTVTKPANGPNSNPNPNP
jgi:hypothetical protein